MQAQSFTNLEYRLAMIDLSIVAITLDLSAHLAIE